MSISKVGCVFLIVVVSILPRAEFGPSDHREDAFRFITKNTERPDLRISLCLISSFAFLVYKLVQKLILGRQQTASIWDENYKNGEMISSVGNSAEMLNSQQVFSILKNPNTETCLTTAKDLKTGSPPD